VSEAGLALLRKLFPRNAMPVPPSPAYCPPSPVESSPSPNMEVGEFVVFCAITIETGV
jgi:hypothetical protein